MEYKCCLTTPLKSIGEIDEAIDAFTNSIIEAAKKSTPSNKSCWKGKLHK